MKKTKLLIAVLSLAFFTTGSLALSACNLIKDSSYPSTTENSQEEQNSTPAMENSQETSSNDSTQEEQDPAPVEAVLYRLAEDGSYAEVVGYQGTATQVRVANEYEGVPVTSIGQFAFSDCTALTEIIIPDSVTSIGQSAFSGCSRLEELTLPFVGSTVKTASDTYQYPLGYIFGIAPYAGGVATTQWFYTTSKRVPIDQRYYIPASLKKVTVTGGNLLYGAFYNCSSLTSVVIGEGISSIGDSAFYGCSSLKDVEIPNSVTSIDASAFCLCDGLTSIVIPNSVTSIGTRAFASCHNLTSIVIPDGVTSIGPGIFSDCSSLTSATIGNGVTSIDYQAFYLCTSLTSVIIGKRVSIIGDAFYYCDNLTSVYYQSDENDWKGISIDVSNTILAYATLYYYSANEPAEEGNYWHYGNNDEILIW
ncbi:MAG: leucine-rich repeat domain-containing protein [Clostridia bacterium]|nr:leucine-rich repeat domain-containing protein [Clostridia bacterium]